jgi:hypothetical protein
MNGPWGDYWSTQREAARGARSADEPLPKYGNTSSSRDDDYEVGDPEDDALAAGGQGPEAVPPVAGYQSK